MSRRMFYFILDEDSGYDYVDEFEGSYMFANFKDALYTTGYVAYTLVVL